MAENDDVFAFGQDGTPSCVNPTSSRVPELSEDELHDVIVVASAGNDLEAIALIDMLAETDIPAIKHGGLIHFGGAGPSEIAVPRKLKDLALAEIKKFRNNANERGVEDSFAPETTEKHQIAPRSDDMALMARLAHATPIALEEILSQFIARAIANAIPDPDDARHLVAAGIGRDEAESLVIAAKIQNIDSNRARLEVRMRRGYLIFGLGVLSYLYSNYRLFNWEISSSGAYFLLAVFSAIIGLGLVADSKEKLSKLIQK